MYTVIIRPFIRSVDAESGMSVHIQHTLDIKRGANLSPTADTQAQVPGIDKTGCFGSNVHYPPCRTNIVPDALRNGGRTAQHLHGFNPLHVRKKTLPTKIGMDAHPVFHHGDPAITTRSNAFRCIAVSGKSPQSGCISHSIVERHRALFGNHFLRYHRYTLHLLVQPKRYTRERFHFFGTFAPPPKHFHFHQHPFIGFQVEIFSSGLLSPFKIYFFRKRFITHITHHNPVSSAGNMLDTVIPRRVSIVSDAQFFNINGCPH